MAFPMTKSPAGPVQTAVYAALQGSTGLTAAFAALGVSRVAGLLPVFDYVPRGADGRPTRSYPFVAFADAQDVPASPTNDCDAEIEHFVTVEAWDEAEARGHTGAKSLAAAVVVAAARILTIPGWSMTVAGVESVRHLPIADGVARSVVTLRYLMDPV
jgi:hypothetical protein